MAAWLSLQAASASAHAALQFFVGFSPHFCQISSLMAAKAEKTEFIDNTARRKWDKEECVLPTAFTIHRFHMQYRYERRAKERAERDEAAVVEVIFLPILLSRSFLSRASHILRSGQELQPVAR
jgi:hypothetical protein